MVSSWETVKRVRVDFRILDQKWCSKRNKVKSAGYKKKHVESFQNLSRHSTLLNSQTCFQGNVPVRRSTLYRYSVVLESFAKEKIYSPASKLMYFSVRYLRFTLVFPFQPPYLLDFSANRREQKSLEDGYDQDPPLGKPMGWWPPGSKAQLSWSPTKMNGLVGGLVAMNFIFPLILGFDYHPNWRSHIFQRGGDKPPTRWNRTRKQWGIWGYHRNGICSPNMTG